MTTPNSWTRRAFTQFSATAIGALFVPRTNAFGRTQDDWGGYADATIIDALASPGPFNVPNRTGSPLSEVMLANARESGITAVNVTVNAGGAGHAAYDNTFREIGYWEREIDAHPNILTKITNVSDLEEAKRRNRLGLIFGFQDAGMLEGDIGRLEIFHNHGVRIIQLTYNLRNGIGDGCLEPGNAGLSMFGRNAVERMNELGILVDVSHCGKRTTSDAIEASTRPIAATHSGCNGVYRHPRNKDDEDLRALAEKGGVLGIYMMPFLNADGPATSEHMIQHIEHAIQVCGEDHVGVGSDNSITPTVADDNYRRTLQAFAAERQRQRIGAPREYELLFVTDLNNPRRMEMLGNALIRRGHAVSRVEKILGGNFKRLFQETWKP